MKSVLILTGAIIGFITFSWISSFIYYFLAGYAGTPPPWAAWYVLFNPISEKTGGRLVLAFGLPFLAIFMAGGKLYELFKSDSNDYADAKWATLSELRKEGLLTNKGVLVGKYKKHYIFNPNDSHTIVSAQTRTGKGVGVIVPNLLLWNGSVVCLDIKHENYEYTAGYRSAHSSGRVFKWDPLADDLKSHGFNPLDQISNDPMDKIMDIRRIAGILLPLDGKDTFWITEARSLFVGLALYVIDQPNEIMPSTIGSIYRLLSAEAELGDICRLVVKNHPELNQTIIATMNRFANKAAKERSGVKSQLDSALEVWKYPKVDAATSVSSFQLKNLRKQKMSIYICVKAGQIEAVSSIIRLFFEFLLTSLTMDLPDPKTEPHKVLVVLDEIHMLGKLETIKSTFTLSAGYGCRVIAAIQDLSVLDEVYGKNGRKIVFANCENQIFFRPKVLDSAREISAMLGNRIVETVSYSQRSGFHYEPKTRNTSYQEKPLMPPAKVMKMENTKGILISANENPVLFDKINFKYDENFKDRLLPPPEIPPLPYNIVQIPKFDTKALQEKVETPDPNQTSIFDRDDLPETDEEFELRVNNLLKETKSKKIMAS